MAPFDELFQHIHQHGIISCKKCKYSIPPTQVDGHVQGRHPTIPKRDRHSIVRSVAALSNIAHSPQEVRLPQQGQKPIPGLPIFHDGLRCTHTSHSGICNYVCRDLTHIQRHSKKKHQWKNPRRRGGNPNHRQFEQTGQIWEERQPCQRLFHARQWPQYVAIQVKQSDQPEPHEGVAGEQMHEVLNQLFERFDKAQQRDDNNIRRRYEPNPWLEHTMWERHIWPHKRWVVSMTKEDRDEEERRQPVGEANPEGQSIGENIDDNKPPGQTDDTSESEEALRQACKATATLIRRSYQVSRVEIVGKPAMYYINRRETGASTSDRPFYAKQKVQTIRRYTDQFVKILRYIWRTEAMSNRPQYRLTDSQQGTLTKLQRAAAEAAKARHVPARQRTQLVEMSSAFWIAMFDHRLGDNEYENGVLSGLAVLGGAGENGGWMPAINYTPILAAMITTMRAIVIRRAWRTRQEQIQLNVRNGITEAYAHQGVVSVFDIVKRDVESFMTATAFGGHPTPMNTIYTQKMYGMKIRYTTKAEGQISWVGNDTVLVRKIQFSMNDVRSVVHGLLAITRQQLMTDLLLLPAATSVHEWRPEGLPKIDISQIRDNHRIIDEGWSFLKDVRNQWPVDGDRWMGMRLWTDASVRRRFVSNPVGPSTELNEKAVHQYMRAVKKFKERLIVLVHMCAGAPARSTELISIQCENGKYARSQRGIFVDNGLVMFVTMYHKGFSASQSMKIVHRFVPREVGEIVVYYLWLVRPFERILQGLGQGQDSFSSWLWEPEPEEEWEVDADQVDDQGGGYESEEEQTKSIENAIEWVDVDVDISRAVAAIPPAEPMNCDGFWNTDRVRRVMRRETAGLIGVPIGISDWRQVYPAIHREFTVDHSIREALTKIYENTSPNTHGDESTGANDVATIRAKQAGHSFQMEEDIYGRLLEQSPFTTIAEKDAFRKVSIDWHRFLQFPSAWQGDSIDPDVRRRVKQEQDDARFHRFEQMRNIDIEGELRRIYNNPRAEFRGAQEDALKLIVGGCPRVVIVMRDRWWEKFVVHVARGGVERRREHRRRPEDRIAGEHEAEVCRGRHQMRSVER